MKLKITNFNKFIRSIILLIFTLIVLVLLTKNVFSHQETKYKTIYVSSGDSIWSIAKEEIRENEIFKNKSTREVVYNIQSLNQLSSSEIYVGQKLLIPIN